MRLDSAAADRLTALVLFLLGAAALYGGFTMDRLEARHIHPASFPGLVPMMLGAALMVCSAALAWSARAPRGRQGAPEQTSWRALGFVIGWSGLYAVAAVGTLPFALATTLYIAGFTLWFLRAEGVPITPLRIGAVLAFAVIAALGITVLFRYGFLVRLP